MASQADLRGTRAVVFGGCGFLGSHLAGALVHAGAETLVYDAAPRHGGVPAAAACDRADVLDAAAVRHALGGADRVFAFAGGGGAPASLRDPLGDLAASCQAQLVLLEAVRAVCPEATVVFPGSRLEYGRPQRLPVDESHPLTGDSPYAIHKSACAAYYRAYAEVYAMRTVVLRLSNPYGPHPLQECYRGFGILNHFMDQAILGRPIELFGDGSQLRDFVFIDDVVEAVVAASGRPDLAGTVINVGAGEGVSLARIAAVIVEVVGCGSIERVPWPPDFSLIETGDFYFDVSRARELLGWRPRTPLRRGLQSMLAARGGSDGEYQ
jgi:UDP-glucose 4-epimerase